jgi:phage-related protein
MAFLMFPALVPRMRGFHKKSKTGTETPQEELDLAGRRYRELVRERAQP